MSRPTPAQSRTNRLVRQLNRRALVAKRTAAKAAHRAERHTIASHLRTMGVDDTTATGMAATLRKKVTKGRKGFALKDGHRRPCTRYTRTQVLAALTTYKPRKADYKAARAHLLDLAA
jgi:hypothetical protein